MSIRKSVRPSDCRSVGKAFFFILKDERTRRLADQSCYVSVDVKHSETLTKLRNKVT